MAKRKRAKLPIRRVVPDRLDLRDRPYQPTVREAPPHQLNTLKQVRMAIRDQDETSACTGFALASVIDILLTLAKRKADANVSPFMLYNMARRYDEFPGYTADDGSSLRGALKAWYRHGACKNALWSELEMPDPKKNPKNDWWQDSARRPLGAYYRVDTRSVTDMQVALHEVGVLYASVVCHSGWDEEPTKKVKDWVVPQHKVKRSDGGHAIALVGYDDRGFIVLNSWGTTWAASGIGILTYEDWLENAMDCWVAQLGVPTDLHLEVAGAVSLRTTGAKGAKVALAADTTLRNRELSPFIVDVENNGELSGSGLFRTQPSDLTALVTIHMEEAASRWKLKAEEPLDVAIYAHGGLVGEESAANSAAKWIPALYEAQLFPIFVMWETDILSTLKNRLSDLLAVAPTEAERRTSGIKDQMRRWYNERLERTFARPGAFCWNEMKDNAEKLSLNANSGLRLLYSEFTKLSKRSVRLHLIGHSAGAIVHSYLTRQLIGDNRDVESLVFMAPAVRTDKFAELVKPHVGKQVKRFATFMLDDQSEQKDSTCSALLDYSRSLLYLVSESFETDRRHMPILGMERYFSAAVDGLPHVTPVVSPGPKSRSTSHGGFDDDPFTMESVIRFIKTGAV